MRAARIENGLVADLWEVSSLTAFDGITLIAVSSDVSIGDIWNGTVIVKPAAPPRNILAEKIAFILQIDTDADALIRAVIGERASQYEGAERESLAYKAAGYTGAVPPKVQAWATAKNQTATWAADSQIATAEDWRNAENVLYAKRLLLKETARAAVDAAALDAVKENWAVFMAALKTSLDV